jgi:tRNA nucleotidyltransferase/poly(A) polymerase
MADYIYLLENRLSPAQRNALRNVRDLARSKALTVFLVGGAVRDLTTGSPVRDLDVVVQGNALKLKKDIEKAGGVITGESDASQSLFVRFPGNVRMEVGSTLSVTFPKPGKPVAKPATILDDLRRRDFTANAMALSLNEGSYGLLMDPLNGVADIENRELRLVSNYGFIEDPVRMIRAARLMARLGWTLDEKTQARYETGRAEDYITAMQEVQRGYETEEIVHEEDPLRILKRLEADGWMKYLAPYWTSAKVNVVELEKLRDTLAQLQMQGIHPDTAAAQFPLITAKLTAKEVATLKQGFPRKGFVAEIDALEDEAKEFAAQLGSKGAALPSQAWKLITSAKPEAVLATAYSTRSATLQAKFKSFFTEWPLARQRMPYALMQEMRIVPDLAGYDELLEKLFFELMDGNLATPEEMKAYLEPYSPPAPPPPVNMRRARAGKKDSKPSKARAKKAAKLEEAEAETEIEVEIPEIPDLDEDLDVLDDVIDEDAIEPETDDVDEEEEEEVEPVAVKAPPAKKVATAPAKKVAPPAPVKAVVKATPAKAVAKKAVAAKKIPAKKAAPAKTVLAKKAAPLAKKVVAKAMKIAAKAVKKPLPKAVAKKAPVKATAKKAAAKVVAKKVAVKTKGKPKAAPAKAVKRR